MNIGVIGSGIIVEGFIKATNKIDGINILAIYSRNKNSERIKEIQTNYYIPLAFDNLNEMFSNSDIDFIYIASPNSLHFEQSLMALKAGKNVICEKPFTTTLKETEILFAEAKSRNLMIFEAILTIHLPNYKLIKDCLDKIGEIKLVQLNYSQYSSRYDLLLHGEVTNVFNPEFSGGSLQDINIYNVHFMMGLFGVPESKKYYANIHPVGVDTSGIMIMKYKNFVATLTGAKDSRSENFVYIQGDKGYIQIPRGGNVCEEIILNVSNNDQITLNAQPIQNKLYYETLEFKRIFDEKDFEAYEHLCNHTKNVIKLLEESRVEAGIIFPADQKN